MISAKLWVLGGAFDHASGGEIFLPPHRPAPAYFAGSIASSLSVGEVRVKGRSLLAAGAVLQALSTAASTIVAPMPRRNRNLLMPNPLSNPPEFSEPASE